MIREFKDSDMELIYPIVFKYWKDELEVDNSIKEILYRLLPNYYYKNKEYSYVLDNTKAFIFASKKDDNPINEINDYDNELVKKYIDYLDYNTNRVNALMTDNSINIGLVASITPKGGERLLKLIFDVCKKNKNDYIYLWTDETCNYSYYERLGYVLVDEYIAKMIDRELKTYIYRLEIK